MDQLQYQTEVLRHVEYSTRRLTRELKKQNQLLLGVVIVMTFAMLVLILLQL